jgi:aryl-alcohol dehydrogenase-like predicted oxidoreductase
MQTKQLGSQGLSASAIGLGCMGMSDFYGERNDEASLKTLEHALHKGVSFWDTADMYGPYTNEELVGKALRGKRSQVTLATKFGIVRDPSDPTVRGFNGSAAYTKTACEASLKRLQTDYIDLYYLHRVDASTPIEETAGAMAELVKEGKIRGIGFSEISSATLRRAHAVHPVTAVQSEYSLWTRDPEDGILETCKELGIAFVAYSPLGRGFLTGQIKKESDFDADDYRRFSPRFQGANFQKNLDLVSALEKMAAAKACSPSQLALAWVLAQGDFIFPIPGTKRIQYLDENIGALELSIDADELSALNSLFPKDAAAGLRYPANMMGSLNK